MNNNLVLISGKSATGKSASLRNLNNPKGVCYLNCENNKALPFKNEFKQATVKDPYQIYSSLDGIEKLEDCHTVVIDSLTYMMDMFETKYITPPHIENTMKAWGDYAQFFKRLMSEYVAKSTKNIIFTGHTLDVLNEADHVMETLVKVKGSLMNTGIESYFSSVISSKKIQTKHLDKYQSKLLNITPEEEAIGFKYVFQTMLTRETVNERIRSPMGMWDVSETYIDNDMQLVLDRLHEYYS